MKRKITFFAILLIVPYTLFGTTWTVSNNPDIPAQFTQISTAIADANTTEGDTLLVAGSSIKYSDFTLNKPFVIIGAGMNNPYGYNTVVNYITLSTSAAFTPSGTRLIGIYVDYSVTFNTSLGSKTIENVVVERCFIDNNITFNGGAGSIYNNDTIRNCVIQDGQIYFAGIETIGVIEIHNNLFDNAIIRDYYYSVSDLSNVRISNNVFINETYDVFDGVNNLIINDNIFFKASPQGCTGCVFTNNTAYASSNNVLPGDGNIGSGNEVRDPKFANYTDINGAFSFAAGYNYHLLANSLDDDSGTAGTERGLYGGAMPVELGSNPAIPQMTEVSFPDNASSVKEDGILNVRLKAKKQN